MNDLLKYCRELKKCELRFNKNYLYLVTKPQKLFGITKTGEIKENLLPNDMRILTQEEYLQTNIYKDSRERFALSAYKPWGRA